MCLSEHVDYLIGSNTYTYGRISVATGVLTSSLPHFLFQAVGLKSVGEGSISIISLNDHDSHHVPNAHLHQTPHKEEEIPESGTDSVKRGRGRPKV